MVVEMNSCKESDDMRPQVYSSLVSNSMTTHLYGL
jgi:hypothetical protein